MLLIAKAALGVGVALALTTVYVFHEGVIRVDVDENCAGGSHVHFWVPAATVSGGLRVVPRHYLQHAALQSRPYLPVLHQVAKELEKYRDAELVDVRGGNHEHVHVSLHSGKLYIDAVDKDQNVHVSLPTETIADVADRLEDAAPDI